MCKKPFQTYGGKICGNCLERIDKDFIVVRDYIYEHKKADMDTIAEDTNVPKAIIMHLLKEGRLTIDDHDGDSGILFCEVCKKPINTGRMCRDCKDKVATTMQKNVTSKPPASAMQHDSRSIKGSAKLQS